MRLAAMVAMFSQFFDEVIVVTCGTHCIINWSHKILYIHICSCCAHFFVYLDQSLEH